MSVALVIGVAVVGLLAWLWHRELMRRAPAMLDWLRTHRTAHGVLLALLIAFVASFPLWTSGDETVAIVCAIAGVAAAGWTLLGLVTNSTRYRNWVERR